MLNVGCTGLERYCFSLEVGGVEAGSEGDVFFSTSWVLDVDSGATTSDCLVSRPVSVYMGPIVMSVEVVDVFQGEGLLFSVAMGVFLANARNTAVFGVFLLLSSQGFQGTGGYLWVLGPSYLHVSFPRPWTGG